ncbi:hypothetical protein IJ425_05830 [bacterium]|nr:hypothetical protein [bacterium]
MAGGKDPIITELEQSLINFLCSKEEDVEKKVSGGIRRVRGLTFNIDVKNPKNASFTVQIGMCEAGFNVANGLKEKGNCFGLERFIRDWYERPTVGAVILKYVQDAKNAAN